MAVFMRSAGGGKNKTKRLYSLAQNERRKWYPSTFPTLITIQFVFCFFGLFLGYLERTLMAVVLPHTLYAGAPRRQCPLSRGRTPRPSTAC